MNELIDSLMCKNGSINLLLMKAGGYSHCRRNIFIVKSLVWESFIYSIIGDLLQGCNPTINPHNDFDRLNNICKSFLLKNGLANKNLVEFFFGFHYGIGCIYFKKIKDIVESDLPVSEKIAGLLEELKEVLNITRIELEGFDFDCEVIGNTHICDNRPCKNAPNVITLIVTEELLENKDVFANIINILKKFLPKKSGVKLILDYRNICAINKRYRLNDSDKRMFNELMNFLDVYFYRCSCVDFNGYNSVVLSDKELKELFKRG